MKRRDRAKSPFLLSAAERKELPVMAPLRAVLEALPDVPAAITGALELADLPIELPSKRTALTDVQKQSAQAVL